MGLLLLLFILVDDVFHWNWTIALFMEHTVRLRTAFIIRRFVNGVHWAYARWQNLSLTGRKIVEILSSIDYYLSSNTFERIKLHIKCQCLTPLRRKVEWRVGGGGIAGGVYIKSYMPWVKRLSGSFVVEFLLSCLRFVLVVYQLHRGQENNAPLFVGSDGRKETGKRLNS